MPDFACEFLGGLLQGNLFKVSAVALKCFKPFQNKSNKARELESEVAAEDAVRPKREEAAGDMSVPDFACRGKIQFSGALEGAVLERSPRRR